MLDGRYLNIKKKVPLHIVVNTYEYIYKYETSITYTFIYTSKLFATFSFSHIVCGVCRLYILFIYKKNVDYFGLTSCHIINAH